jgi:predicted amidophosphoribosyltransferase
VRARLLLVDPATALRGLGSALVPPRCAVCGAGSPARELLCSGCARAIAAGPAGRGAVAGVGSVTWAAPYDGAARRLVAALKFRAGLGLAADAGRALAAALDGVPGWWTVVAVPPAPLRARRRGFDPAELLATELAKQLGCARAAVLRRANGPRQVGRPRRERLASPPRVRAVCPAPARVLIVDDVLTTGATLSACAEALRGAGAGEVRGAVFARALGRPDAGAYDSAHRQRRRKERG